MTVKRVKVIRWLRRNGFQAAAAGATGHIHFKHLSGVKVTLRGHGPAEVGDTHTGTLVRQLVKAGFDRNVVKQQLFGNSKAGTNRKA